MWEVVRRDERFASGDRWARCPSICDAPWSPSAISTVSTSVTSTSYAGRGRPRPGSVSKRWSRVTFEPHPMAVLRPDHAPPTLSGMEERPRYGVVDT